MNDSEVTIRDRRSTGDLIAYMTWRLLHPKP